MPGQIMKRLSDAPRFAQWLIALSMGRAPRTLSRDIAREFRATRRGLR